MTSDAVQRTAAAAAAAPLRLEGISCKLIDVKCSQCRSGVSRYKITTNDPRLSKDGRRWCDRVCYQKWFYMSVQKPRRLARRSSPKPLLKNPGRRSRAVAAVGLPRPYLRNIAQTALAKWEKDFIVALRCADGSRRLWANVLLQAVRDCLLKSRLDLRYEALAWFKAPEDFTIQGSFAWVCNEIDVDTQAALADILKWVKAA